MTALSQTDIATLGARAEKMVAELGAISSEPGRLVRLFLTPEHRRAADLVARWMREAGMGVSEDALGTVRGRWQDQKKRLLVGSHIDTVIDAGRYDGPFGVVAGILAVDHFTRTKTPLPLGIDVLAFGDEEGSRFPSTLSSSSACAGAFDGSTLALKDRDGIAFVDALKAYGKDPSEIAAARYSTAEAQGYVELHIEQGPVLEAENQPLGIVSAIVGQSRLRVTVGGEAGHAGTVPMTMRRDALAGAAEMVLAVERIGRHHSADRMVATVGRIEAIPGATNIIPAAVTFTIDLRSMTDDVRRTAVEHCRSEAQHIAASRNLTVGFEPFHEAATTACAPRLQDLLATAIGELGHRPVRLPSGAGHDAQMMAKLCPAAMLFVRCRGGVSHNPAEFASETDMGIAIAALVRFIELFAAGKNS